MLQLRQSELMDSRYADLSSSSRLMLAASVPGIGIAMQYGGFAIISMIFAQLELFSGFNS